MCRYFLIWIFLYAGIPFTHAQQREFVLIDSNRLYADSMLPQEYQRVNDDAIENYSGDTSLNLYAINISKDSVSSWKDEQGYAYMKTLDSLLKLKKQEALDALNDSGKNISPSFLQRIFSTAYFQVLLWTFAGLFVLFILYRLFINNGLFRRDSTSAEIAVMEDSLNSVHPLNYTALLEHALSQENYRMAVRCLFLLSLNKLADEGLLIRSAEKTNCNYLRELPVSRQKDFATLILHYEYVWYGNLSISKQQFDYIENLFTGFNQKN